MQTLKNALTHFLTATFAFPTVAFLAAWAITSAMKAGDGWSFFVSYMAVTCSAFLGSWYAARYVRRSGLTDWTSRFVVLSSVLFMLNEVAILGYLASMHLVLANVLATLLGWSLVALGLWWCGLCGYTFFRFGILGLK